MSTRKQTTKSRAIALLLVSLLLAAGALFLVGCAEEKGPLEKAGEKADEAIEDAGDAIEDAADDVEDAVDGDG